jgi:hypothetical protein
MDLQEDKRITVRTPPAMRMTLVIFFMGILLSMDPNIMEPG